MRYKGFEFIRRYDRTKSRWLIVGADGWTVARANTIAKAKAIVCQLVNDCGRKVTL